MRLQGLSIVGDRLQFIISEEVYTTQLSSSTIDNSGQHLNLVGGESHGHYQNYSWMAAGASTFQLQTNFKLVAAFQLPGPSRDVSFGHLIVRNTATEQLDHRLVDLNHNLTVIDSLGNILPDGLYGSVTNTFANKSLLFRAREYGKGEKVVVFREGSLLDASGTKATKLDYTLTTYLFEHSGHSSHLPVESNEKAIQPYYYLLRDSLRSRLKVATEMDANSLTMPLFSSLPVFGFIHQNTAHVIDAVTQTVFIFSVSSISDGQSANSSSLFVGTVNFNQYFVCVSASLQGGKTTALILVLGVILLLLAFVALFCIGHRGGNRSTFRRNITKNSSFSSSSSSANSSSVSDTNKRRLKMMIAEMGSLFKNRPCFNPVNYKVKSKKKKIKKKILKSGLEPNFKNKLKK